MAYGLGEVVYPDIMRFPVFQLPHITVFVSGSYDSGFFVRTTHVSSKGLRRPLWGFEGRECLPESILRFLDGFRGLTGHPAVEGILRLIRRGKAVQKLEFLENLVHLVGGLVLECVDGVRGGPVLTEGVLLNPLLTRIPVAFVHEIPCHDVNALAVVADAHPDREILGDFRTFVCPSLQGELDVATNVHSPWASCFWPKFGPKFT